VRDTLKTSQKKVIVFVAPPASGKTHVICLLATYFIRKANSVAIVLPSNYLKAEFKEEFKTIHARSDTIDILNILEFVRSQKQYDFVLVDESHNLKSFIELDPSVVRTIAISSSDIISGDLEALYLPAGRQFSAQQIAYGSAASLLAALRNTRHAAYLGPVYKSPTSWMYFVYAWRDPLGFLLKAVNTTKLGGFTIPKKRLLLFSATPLSNDELRFYCGIEPDSIQRSVPVETLRSPAPVSSLYLSVKDSLTPTEKLKVLRELLGKTQVRTLILANNFHQVKVLAKGLRRGRLFVGSGTHEERMRGFEEFLEHRKAVLLTSSTVFWEGITIRGVRLLVIPDPPFPRPLLLDLRRKRIIDDRADVERRLQQGVGRIARRPDDNAVCVLLFSLKKLLSGHGRYFTKEDLFEEASANIILQKTAEYCHSNLVPKEILA
jgi:hypothetical protein